MTTAVALTTSRDLAFELLSLLRDLDPARWRVELEESAQAKLQRIAAMLEELRASALSEFDGLADRLRELLGKLDEYTPSMGLTANEATEAWARFRVQMQPAYEALAGKLREFEIHVPSLRPTNYKRNLFHLASAGFSLCLIEFILDQPSLLQASAAFAVAAWTMELSRKRWPGVNRTLMRLFQPVAHPHESWRINSATWYATALVLLALTGNPVVQTTAVVVLGVGDPVAALVGRRFGKHKLINGRSVEGSSAFFVSSAIAVVGVLLALHGLPLATVLVIALAGALPATFAELLSKRVDDNLTIPLSAAAGAMAALSVLGLN